MSNVNEIKNKNVFFSDFLQKIDNNDFVKEIIDGLSSKQKYIPSKFFYDKKGSGIFDKITKLDEYYPTRTEKSILKKIAPKIANNLIDKDIIELGNGDGSKMHILLSAVSKDILKTILYIPVDYSQASIKKTTDIFTDDFPEIKIHGIVADFLSQLEMIPRRSSRLFCFFGSTLGNLTSEQAGEFLKNIRACMQKGDKFLLGIDMVKDKAILERAYNDSQQVTSDFNKNILRVANKIAKTNFNINDFEHLAFFNEDESRIEMHLKASKQIKITSPHISGNIIINKGETIHTENSHKYTTEYIKNLAESCNFTVLEVYTDENKWFSVVHYAL